MKKPKLLSERLAEARRELDQCAEWLDRISVDVRTMESAKVPELVGSQEAAEILGINRAAFNMRVKRDLVVDPVARLACGPIWLRSDIEAMIEEPAA